MTVLVLSGCYTVLLRESARIEDNESESAESDRAYEEVAFQDERWAMYYDGAAPWWQEDQAYEISDDQPADGSAGSTHRAYGRRREVLKEDNSSAATGLFYSAGSAVLPSSISTNPAAPGNDANKSQNTNSSGSGNQAAKSNSESNTQRHYGARENAKKK